VTRTAYGEKATQIAKKTPMEKAVILTIRAKEIIK
jgi:hypothetical protein